MLVQGHITRSGGPSRTHCPHHGAKKSTSTGPWRIMVSSPASSTSITRPSGFGFVRAVDTESESEGAIGNCVLAYSDEDFSIKSDKLS